MRCEECGCGISSQPFYQGGLTFCSQRCSENAGEQGLNDNGYSLTEAGYDQNDAENDSLDMDRSFD